MIASFVSAVVFFISLSAWHYRRLLADYDDLRGKMKALEKELKGCLEKEKASAKALADLLSATEHPECAHFAWFCEEEIAIARKALEDK